MHSGAPVSNWIRTPVQNLPGILAPEDQNLGVKERKGIKVNFTQFHISCSGAQTLHFTNF